MMWGCPAVGAARDTEGSADVTDWVGEGGSTAGGCAVTGPTAAVVAAVVAVSVIGAGGGVLSVERDSVEVTLVITGTVEKSPGVCSISTTAPAATRVKAAAAMTVPSSRVFRISRGRWGSFTSSPTPVPRGWLRRCAVLPPPMSWRGS